MKSDQPKTNQKAAASFLPIVRNTDGHSINTGYFSFSSINSESLFHNSPLSLGLTRCAFLHFGHNHFVIVVPLANPIALPHRSKFLQRTMLPVMVIDSTPVVTPLDRYFSNAEALL
jgi:hypothetical protein